MGRRRAVPYKVFRPKNRHGVSPFWSCDYTTPGGRRIRETTGCTEREAALRITGEWYRSAQHEHADSLAGIERPSEVTLLDLGDAFIDHMRPRRKPRYVAALEDNIRAYLLPFFGGATAAATLTKKHVEGFERAVLSGSIITGAAHVRRRGIPSAATCNRVMSTLRGVLKFGVKEGLLLHDPSSGIRKLKEHTEEVYRALTDEEIAALLRELGASRGDAVALTRWLRFMLEVGLRDDEGDTLQWRQVHRSTKCLVMGAAQTKGGKVRRVPLTDEAIAVLDEVAADLVADGAYPKVGAVFGAHNRRTALLSAWKRTGLPGRAPSPHDLRETCASRAVAAGLDLRELMEMFGWESPQVAARYLSMYGDRWARMAEKLNATRRPK